MEGRIRWWRLPPVSPTPASPPFLHPSCPPGERGDWWTHCLLVLHCHLWALDSGYWDSYCLHWTCLTADLQHPHQWYACTAGAGGFRIGPLACCQLGGKVDCRPGKGIWGCRDAQLSIELVPASDSYTPITKERDNNKIFPYPLFKKCSQFIACSHWITLLCSKICFWLHLETFKCSGLTFCLN